MFTTLTPERIAELRAQSRERGVAVRELKVFMESGEAGTQVSLTEGAFAGKKVATVYQGFNTAVKKLELSEQVNVLKDGDDLYLLRKDA